MFEMDTPKEVKLLKKIKKIQSKSEKNVAYLKDLEIDSNDYFLKKLLQKNYIYYIQSDDWGNNIDAFTVTDEGQHISYYRNLRTKEVLLKSVVIPVTVAFLTTLATNYLVPFLISLIDK